MTSRRSLEIERLPKNAGPSNAGIHEVQGILSVARKELGNLDSDIQQLESQLIQLKIQRDQVQATISEYETVLSPIQRAPIDILRIIFQHCLPTGRNPMMLNTEAPMLLTRVCRSWRATVLSSPRLWAQVHLVLLNEGDISSDRDLVEKYRMKYKALEDWLARSGSSPLSISIKYTLNKANFSVPWTPKPLSKTITKQLSILCKFADSWQNIQLDMPHDIYRLLQTMIPQSKLRSLRSLQINCLLDRSTNTRPHVGPKDPKLNILLAPDFKHLSISGYFFVIAPSFLPTSLTTMFCHQNLTLSQAITLLTSCHNLVKCLLTIFAGLDHPTFPQTIHLLRLRALHILERCNPQAEEVLAGFYECIDAPRLEWMDYNTPFTLIATDPPIIALLRNLHGLKKLTLNINECSHQTLKNILHASHGITHLVMGMETRTYVGGPLSIQNNALSREGYMWNFDELFNVHVEGQEERRILLPKLTTLEISSSQSMYISAKVVLDFVLGRIDPSSETVGVLKHRDVLCCENPTDIAKIIRQEAQRKGVDIKLELKFVEKPPQRKYLYSPHINGLDDQAWIFADDH